MLVPSSFWFLLVLSLVLVAAAAARPFWIYGASSFKRGDVDVAIAIDVSASMWVKDLGGLSRLDVAIREVLNLYTQEILTPGDRVALFVFGTTAVRKVHLSSDAERFINQVARVAPPSALSGDAFPWDSDIAAAFEHVYSSIDNQDRFEAGEEDWAPRRRSDRMVILLTDGDFVGDREQTSRLDQSLAEFQRRGLVVYPIGVGSPVGTDLDSVLLDYVPGIDYDETLVADLEGIRTRLETEGLLMLEQRTGGRSFQIDSAGISAAPFLRNAVNSHRAISFSADSGRRPTGGLAVGACAGCADLCRGGPLLLVCDTSVSFRGPSPGPGKRLTTSGVSIRHPPRTTKALRRPSMSHDS